MSEPEGPETIGTKIDPQGALCANQLPLTDLSKQTSWIRGQVPNPGRRLSPPFQLDL